MRPAQSRVSPPLAVSPVRPSSTSVPAAESSRASPPVRHAAAGPDARLSPFSEGHPVRQRFEVGAVEMHLELIARLRVEARLAYTR